MHHDPLPSLLRPPMTRNLCLHIRAVLDILSKVADVAANLRVRLQREGDQGHEAKGKPFPALRHLRAEVSWGFFDEGWGRRAYAAGEVAAVLALHGYLLCAFEGGVEDWMAGRKSVSLVFSDVKRGVQKWGGRRVAYRESRT
jgi:hypothetical protein